MAEDFDIKTAGGLTEAEAAKLLTEVGCNELHSAKSRSAFAIAFEVTQFVTIKFSDLLLFP